MRINLREDLQLAFALNEAQLVRLFLRAPYTYKIYSIPKKNGGSRLIAQPAKETKYIQRWLIENVFSRLPVHGCATAYSKGASIKNNASLHAENEFIVKLDFQNFFPSISESDLIRHLTRHLGSELHERDIQDMARISSIRMKGSNKGNLSIGAPSSPLLSNSMLFEFDAMIESWCNEHDVTYSRYADDLTFSTNTKNISGDIATLVEEAVGALPYPKLKINEKKTIFLSKKYQRRVTGLIINNEGELSVGRDRKREISALIHRYTLNRLSDEETYQLQGLLSFAYDIEPLFLERMKRKYGAEKIADVMAARK